MVTKREILVSIAIVCVMFLIGLLISSAISDALMDSYQEYNTALQIDNDKEIFEYGMRTNIGNAFVYGDLKAVDTVTYERVSGEYSYIKEVKEKYTRHSRTVTKTRTDSKGKTQTYTEIEYYWTWDVVATHSKHSEKITFLDVEFAYNQIPFPSENYITTVKTSSDTRYVYYGAPAECKGTLYAELGDKTIADASFYYNSTIEETIKSLESNWQLVLFWIGWELLTGGLVIGFYYIDNRWLEDKGVKSV